jgi:hypothetical protein
MVNGLAGKVRRCDERDNFGGVLTHGQSAGLTSATMAGTIPAWSAALVWGTTRCSSCLCALELRARRKRRLEMSWYSEAGLDF